MQHHIISLTGGTDTEIYEFYSHSPPGFLVELLFTCLSLTIYCTFLRFYKKSSLC